MRQRGTLFELIGIRRSRRDYLDVYAGLFGWM